MICSAHQPHYLPWLGYCDKIARSDVFVLLDNVQYKRREFQNRSRVRTASGWGWLTVPVLQHGKREQLFREVEIDPTSDWRRAHWATLKQHYGGAPHWGGLSVFLEKFYAAKWRTLFDLCDFFLRDTLRRLDIRTRVVRESELGTGGLKTDRIAQVCAAVGADTYLSGPGAKAYLDEALLSARGVRVAWQAFVHPVYPQRYPGFEPNMAVLDLLANCGVGSREALLGAEAHA